MNLTDRLTARSLLLDETYARASQAEHRAEQAEAKLKEHETRIEELAAENAALRGEPNRA